MIQPVGREGTLWPSQQRQPSSARASTACKHTGMPHASPCAWLVMNKKTKQNHCWKQVLADMYPQHCSDNNNQTSELTTIHQNLGRDKHVWKVWQVWVTYYKKIKQKYPAGIKVVVVKKANSCCGGREPPVGMYNCPVFNLFCKSFSALLWHLQQVKTAEPCNSSCEEASETSRIYPLNMTVCYSNSKNNPQRFSTFTANYIRAA